MERGTSAEAATGRVTAAALSRVLFAALPRPSAPDASGMASFIADCTLTNMMSEW
jgi:hypothetical protein